MTFSLVLSKNQTMSTKCISLRTLELILLRSIIIKIDLRTGILMAILQLMLWCSDFIARLSSNCLTLLSSPHRFSASFCKLSPTSFSAPFSHIPRTNLMNTRFFTLLPWNLKFPVKYPFYFTLLCCHKSVLILQMHLILILEERQAERDQYLLSTYCIPDSK